MVLIRPVVGFVVVSMLAAGSGCRSAPGSRFDASHAAVKAPEFLKPVTRSPAVSPSGAAVTDPSTTIQPVAFGAEDTAVESVSQDDDLATTEILMVDVLVTEVLARNPSLTAAHAAWSAAANRYPQVVALDDPMLQTMFAPGSFAGNSPVQSSYYVGFAQKVPWHGKRELRGEMALWEANAAAWDTHETRLRLTLATQIAYFDYYLVLQEQELNRANVRVLEDFRSTARSKYEANLVIAQDVSLAELELAKLQQREVELSQQERIAIARINTLLHRVPQHPLPPPTKKLSISPQSFDLDRLVLAAIDQRPELAALSSRLQSEQNAAALACKEYYPDFEIMGRYDAFWTDVEQRGQVGMNMNVPLNRRRRSAAVDEALFRVSRLRAEYAQLTDTIREDVAAAAFRLDQARRVAELYERQVLPAAEASLADAQAAYIAGTLDFLRLLSARRQLVEEQTGYQRALADYHRNLAELARAVGNSAVFLAQSEMSSPAPIGREE